MRDAADEAISTLKHAQAIRSALTGIKTSSDKARANLDAMVEAVRAKLERIESLIAKPTTAYGLRQQQLVLRAGRFGPDLDRGGLDARRLAGARLVAALLKLDLQARPATGRLDLRRWRLSFGPLSVNRTGESDRLAIVKLTRPAPKSVGRDDDPVCVDLRGHLDRRRRARRVVVEVVSSRSPRARRAATAASAAKPSGAPPRCSPRTPGAHRRNPSRSERPRGAARCSERGLDHLGRDAVRRPPRPASPGSASRRTTARAIGPWAGEMTAVPIRPTSRVFERDRVAGCDRAPRAAARAGGGWACPW